jgi:hypothetical protein
MSLWGKFDEILEEYYPDVCFIEGVQLWGSVKSQTSAKRGDTFLLSYLIGGYCHLCTTRGVEFHIINPSTWKGQLPKEVVHKRIHKLLPELKYDLSEHTMDAVGLGLYVNGQ